MSQIVAGPQSIGTLSNPVRVDPTGTTPQPVTQSGPWSFNITASNTAISGQQAVTTAAVNLGTNTVKGLRVLNNVGSNANAYLGPSGVTTSSGYELTPGQYVDLPLTNTSQIYVVAASNNTSTISWIGTN